MKNLDLINPSFMRPSRFSRVGAFLLIILTLMCIALAYGPVSEVPLMMNPIVVPLIFLLFIGISLLIFPAIFNWNWRAGYFGATPLCIASLSLLSAVPCAVLFIYGKAPLEICFTVAAVYGLSHLWWCRKFLLIYDHLYSTESLRDVVYREEHEAVYYLQRGDKYLLDEFYGFSQSPPNRYFVIFPVLAFSIVLFTDQAKEITGIPLTHLFLIVAALPVSWLCAGLGTRSILIFYWFPAKIKVETGKEVYVDLVSTASKLDKTLAADLKKAFGKV